MLTRNSCKSYFGYVLISVKREIPVSKFIVVDGYSRDRTIDVVKDVFPDATIIQTMANLAEARKMAELLS